MLRNCYSLFRMCFVTGVIASASPAPLPALAATIDYPGAAEEPSPFPFPDEGGSDVIYPAGSPSGNTVNFNSGDFLGSVYGGATYSAADVTGNTVNIKGGKPFFGTYGGRTDSGAAHGNTVDITSGDASSATGGQSKSGVVYNNRVFLRGGNGGHTISGGKSGNNNSYDNSVFMSGGIVINVMGGSAYGAGTANNNTVIIDGGRVRDSVYGGFGNSGASNNSITILDDATVAGVRGAESQAGPANNNTVTISSGTITGVVVGVYGETGAVNNSVIISGGTFSRDIRGGWVNTGAAINNTVTISGAPVLTNSIISGGLALGAADVLTGNTLNINGFQGGMRGIQNFQNYNFTLPAHVQNGDTLLTVTNPVNMTGSTVTVNTPGGNAPFGPGTRIILIEGTVTNFPSTAVGRHGSILYYNWTLSSGDLIATLDAIELDPGTKALSEAHLTGLITLNQGADLITREGMHAARSDHNGKNKSAGTLIPFAAVEGGSSRYDTGSHADVDSFNAIAGLAWNTQLDMQDNLMLGAFFETGTGGYDTYNSFSNADGVHGDGTVNYYGGGVLGRYDADFGGYLETSARMGQVDTDFDTDDLQDATGAGTKYDSDSLYYGAHVGLGYIWDITEQVDLDLYGKYIWTHEDDDSVTTSTGDPVHFKDTDSQRLRGGTRLSYDLSHETVTVAPYIGAAYEHEFDGEAKATTYGHDIEVLDLQGGTGIGEVGINLQPVEDGGFGIDLGIQGYTGVREGFGGSAQMKWEF